MRGRRGGQARLGGRAEGRAVGLGQGDNLRRQRGRVLGVRESDQRGR